MASSNKGIFAVSIAVSEKAFLSEIGSYGTPERNDERFHNLRRDMQDYFEGKKTGFARYKLDISLGTDFQQKVWKKLLEIPYGETRSYTWVAEQIKKPNAVRAVGQALGRNPLPIIIPCHRVLANSGELCGYAGGLRMKRLLLRLETSA